MPPRGSRFLRSLGSQTLFFAGIAQFLFNPLMKPPSIGYNKELLKHSSSIAPSIRTHARYRGQPGVIVGRRANHPIVHDEQ